MGRRFGVVARGGRLRRSFWYAVLAITFVTCVLAVVVEAAVFGDPRLNRLAMMSANLWPVAAPHVVLLSLACVVLGVLGARRGPRGFGLLTAVVAAVSLAASTTFTVQIVHAVDRAGGSANPVAALALGPMTGRPDRREVFTTAQGRPMHAVIYQPRSGRPAPVLMYIHGGGWVMGSAGNLGHDMRWFADRGWLVVSVGYPLASRRAATWKTAPLVVACGLVWTSRNAARLGGDPRRLVVAGDSAGGNLAINLGYSAASGRAVSSCGGTVPTPRAVVVQYPVVDPQAAYDHGNPSIGMGPKGFISEYIGGTPTEFPGRMRAITSTTYLSNRAPETLVIEPEKDGLIPSPSVFRFAEKAREAGADVTVAPIPWANHAYSVSAAGSLGNRARLTITEHYLSSITDRKAQ